MSGSVSVAAMSLGATEPAALAAVDSIRMGLQLGLHLAVVSKTCPPEVHGVAPLPMRLCIGPYQPIAAARYGSTNFAHYRLAGRGQFPLRP